MTSSDKHEPPPTTEEWARAFGIATALTLPAIADFDEPCPFTAREIATRAIILHGVVAVAYQVDPGPIVEWYREQGLWDNVTTKERDFLLNSASRTEEESNRLCWCQEAEWTLLWIVKKVETLGLPTHPCDTRRLVDEIMPELGMDIAPFLNSAELRSPGELLAEDDRHYDLWCRYFQTRHQSEHPLPCDLDVGVLYQRRYAFEWLTGAAPWDDVTCDA